MIVPRDYLNLLRKAVELTMPSSLSSSPFLSPQTVLFDIPDVAQFAKVCPTAQNNTEHITPLDAHPSLKTQDNAVYNFPFHLRDIYHP